MNDSFADIVGTAPVFADSFPKQRSVSHVQPLGEGVGLYTPLTPKVAVGGQDGHVGKLRAVLELLAKTGAVVVEPLEVRPPRVILVEVGAVLNPSRKLGFGRTVVESVPDAVRDATLRTLVGADFQQFQRGVENAVGVGHLFTAN